MQEALFLHTYQYEKAYSYNVQQIDRKKLDDVFCPQNDDGLRIWTILIYSKLPYFSISFKF